MRVKRRIWQPLDLYSCNRVDTYSRHYIFLHTLAKCAWNESILYIYMLASYLVIRQNNVFRNICTSDRIWRCTEYSSEHINESTGGFFERLLRTLNEVFWEKSLQRFVALIFTLLLVHFKSKLVKFSTRRLSLKTSRKSMLGIAFETKRTKYSNLTNL